MMKKNIFCLIIILTFLLIGCTSNKKEENIFFMKNIKKGVFTYTNGKDFYHKIISEYEITNIGETKSKNAILKINIYLNNRVIHQELIDIEPLNSNENITKKISYNYDNHRSNNRYRIIAEILIDYNQNYILEDIINN
jgi:hypothetical protein